MVIRPDDRVATVIGQDASLIDVFTSLSPAFERLRNPAMRKVMARLVTVEQAARMAGIDATLLVERLNTHLAEAGAPAPAASAVAPPSREAASSHDASARSDAQVVAGADEVSAPASAPEPPALAHIPAAQRNELDVRAELRAGREPFSLIMAALRERQPDGAFAVRAVFEPVPLYAVMAKQGLAHHTERLADDDWRVWFYPAPEDAVQAPAHGAAAAEPAAQDAAAPADDTGVVVLDVRDLEPPEPMMRTLAALEQLPAGGTLVQLNVRVPQFLLPLLEERGFVYEVREQEPGLVRVFIRHRPA